MLKRSIGWILFFVMVLSPVMVVGMDLPKGNWLKEPGLAEWLGLSPEQISQLEELYKSNRANLRNLRQSLKAEEAALDALIQSGELDEAAIMAQFEKVQELRQSLETERFRLLVQVRAIIGPESYQLLTSRVQELKAQRRNACPKTVAKLVP